jgi:stage V sporulation protein S
MPATLKVSSRSTPNAVAGALASMARSHGRVEMQVVGAGALNQAIKAVAIARGYVAPAGYDLSCKPTFADVEIDGQSRTAIRLQVTCEWVAEATPADRRVIDVTDAAAAGAQG